MYGTLPNTGLNFSLPIYLTVGLIMLICGGVMLVANKVKGRV